MQTCQVPGHQNEGLMIREVGPEEENGDAEEVVPVVNALEEADDSKEFSDIDLKETFFFVYIIFFEQNYLCC